MITVYADCETGGLKDEPIIQLAAVAVDQDFNEVGTFEQKLQFDPMLCDASALAINGWTAERWKNAISPFECVRLFSEFLRPHSTVEMISKRTGKPYQVARLAGYNILTFDLPRLRALYGDAFCPFSYHVRDVLQRAMFFFDEHDSLTKPKDLKLTTLRDYFGIDVSGAHEALADVRATVALYRRLVQ